MNSLRILLYSIIFLLSVFGNLLIIVVLVVNKRMRTVTNSFLLSLAISDLMMAIFCMPFTLIPNLLEDFIFGAAMCKIVAYLMGKIDFSVSLQDQVFLEFVTLSTKKSLLTLTINLLTAAHAYCFLSLFWNAHCSLSLWCTLHTNVESNIKMCEKTINLIGWKANPRSPVPFSLRCSFIVVSLIKELPPNCTLKQLWLLALQVSQVDSSKRFEQNNQMWFSLKTTVCT